MPLLGDFGVKGVGFVRTWAGPRDSPSLRKGRTMNLSVVAVCQLHMLCYDPMVVLLILNRAQYYY